MQTNFYFLKDQWPTFYDRANRAEQLARTDHRASLAYARMALELAVSWMYRNDQELRMPFDGDLSGLLLTPEFKEQFNYKMYNELHLIRKTGNLAIHNKAVSAEDAYSVLENLYYFSKWFAKSYSTASLGDLGIFDWDLVSVQQGNSLTKKQLDELQQKMDEQLNAFQKEQFQQQEERKVLQKKMNYTNAG